MRTLFTLLVLTTLCLSVHSTSAQDTTGLFRVAEEMPRFPGCESIEDVEKRNHCAQLKLVRYIGSIPYPMEAKELGLNGHVDVLFIINIDGKISNVQIKNSSKHKILDDACIEHVQKMPDWIPGKNRGKNVSVQYQIPFNFKIRDPEPIEEFTRKKKKKKGEKK